MRLMIRLARSSVTVVRSFGPGPSISARASSQSPSASRAASPKRWGTAADCAPRPWTGEGFAILVIEHMWNKNAIVIPANAGIAGLLRPAGQRSRIKSGTTGSQISLSRGISSTKLQGRFRLSSCSARIPSQPSFTAPLEPGRAKI